MSKLFYSEENATLLVLNNALGQIAFMVKMVITLSVKLMFKLHTINLGVVSILRLM